MKMTDKISNLVDLPGLTVLGKITLPITEIVGTKPAKKYFKPFSGGSTIGERLRAEGIRL
jgi:hypothetical protein